MEPFLVIALGMVSLMGQLHNYGIDEKQIQQNPHLKNIRMRRNAEYQPYSLENKNSKESNAVEPHTLKLKADYEPYVLKYKENKKPDPTQFSDEEIDKIQTDFEPNALEEKGNEKHLKLKLFPQRIDIDNPDETQLNDRKNKDHVPKSDVQGITPLSILNDGHNIRKRNTYGSKKTRNGNSGEFSGSSDNRYGSMHASHRPFKKIPSSSNNKYGSISTRFGLSKRNTNRLKRSYNYQQTQTQIPARSQINSYDNKYINPYSGVGNYENSYSSEPTRYGGVESVTRAFIGYNRNNYGNNNGYNGNNNGYNAQNNAYNAQNNGYGSLNNIYDGQTYSGYLSYANGTNGNNTNYNRNSPYYNGNNPNYNGNSLSYNSNSPNYNGNSSIYNRNSPNYNGNSSIYNRNSPYYNGNSPNYNGYPYNNGFNTTHRPTKGIVSSTTPKIISAQVINNFGCAMFMKNISLFGKKFCVPKESVEEVTDSDEYM